MSPGRARLGFGDPLVEQPLEVIHDAISEFGFRRLEGVAGLVSLEGFFLDYNARRGW